MPHDPVERLRAHKRRATPQRRAILDAFDGGPAEHLSADEVHARASARVNGIGRGTVYATLADLSELGLVATVGDQDPIRYESNTAAHDHFRCRRCLRLFDVTLPAPATEHLSAEGWLVESTAVVVHGVCRNCQDYARGLEDGARAVTKERQLDDAAIGTLACIQHDSALGPLVMAATPDGVARVAFESHADYDALLDRARTRRGGRAARGRCSTLIEGVDAFLDGAHEPLPDIVDWDVVGTARRTSLLHVHDEVAWGTSLSYHRIRGCLDDGAYACGYAMGTNPIPLLMPCHRIGCGQQAAEHYVGGETARAWLERLEH